MRILVTSAPGLGHAIPLVPLAQVLARAGHELLWASGADTAPLITRAGLTPVTAGLTAAERHAEYHARYPEWADLSPQELPAHMFPRLFAAVSAPPTLEALRSIAADWEPDLIVHEVGELAAPIVAAIHGIPHVTQGFGARLRRERLEAADELLAPQWRAAGLAPRPFGGAYDYLYLDIYPPVLDPGYATDIPRVELLRPTTINEPYDEAIGEWIARRDDRPLVYVTFGTVFNAAEGGFNATVEALLDLDVRALVTVGPRGDTDAFGALPEHVFVAPYVPQQVTMSHTDVVVSHSGSGTFLAALAQGLPQLCLPRAADQFTNAAAGSRAGAAIQCSPQEADRDLIRDSVATLLSDDSYRMAARRVAADIAAMPSPESVASFIVERFGPT